MNEAKLKELNEQFSKIEKLKGEISIINKILTGSCSRQLTVKYLGRNSRDTREYYIKDSSALYGILLNDKLIIQKELSALESDFNTKYE